MQTRIFEFSAEGQVKYEGHVIYIETGFVVGIKVYPLFCKINNLRLKMF